MNNRFSVRFYGVRGSIPTPITSTGIAAKLEAALAEVKPDDLADEASRKRYIESLPDHVSGIVGGNSACVMMEVDGHTLIFDAGTGIRELGFDLLKREFGKGKGLAHIIFSHTHWDHIMGLPFFGPLFVPGNQFRICGVHSDLEKRLRGQQQFQYFPINFDVYGSDIQFDDFSKRTSYKLGATTISWREQYHPGKSYAYRIDFGGKSVVYATDAEYKDQTPEGLKEAAAFFKGADVVIFDSQYTLVESLEKEDWGHSSTFIGIKLALQAGVKKMYFFHHEPTYSDFHLMKILESSREFLEMIAPFNPLQLELAMEGHTITVLGDDDPSTDPQPEAEQASQ